MEKSFVTPFLFDIKRSEVKGPILQFQSTVFDKDDIKKMVKTLNKASGDAGISETRLDSYFDVWYPTLESKLNELKSSVVSEKEDEEEQKIDYSSEILEEILELSRDNQKLLKTPDTKLYEDIATVKNSLEEISIRNTMLYENRRTSKKYNSMLLEEIMHISGRGSYGFLMTLSLFKEDFPWIYDMGKELLDILKGKNDPEEKAKAVRDFRELIDFTCGHPIMRDIYARNKENFMFMKDLPYFISRYLEEMSINGNY